MKNIFIALLFGFAFSAMVILGISTTVNLRSVVYWLILGFNCTGGVAIMGYIYEYDSRHPITFRKWLWRNLI